MGHIVTDHKRRWPGGCIPWRFSAGLSQDEKERLRGAMQRWEGRANIRFIERTTQSSYVTFKTEADIDGVHHSDHIGMKGGEQFVSLDPITPSDGLHRASRHEIGHAIGLNHEHQRCDRDDFVTVSPNIKLERIGDYLKLCGSDVKTVGPYDFGSVMHYNPSKRGTSNDTMDLTGTSGVNKRLLRDSDRENITLGDVAAVNELHGGNAHVYQLTGDGRIEATVR